MTVFDASLKLYAWFSDKDTFTEEDLLKIMLISEEPERDRAAFFCALRSFEQLEMISLYEKKEKKTWVLKRCFAAADQNVTISYMTAIQISHVINSFCEMTKNEVDKCDPLKITERDVKNLLAVMHLESKNQLE